MSRVSATPWPAFGMVWKVCWDPAATRFPARQPVATGVGAAVGAAVATGVAPGSAATIRIQPASSVSGLVRRDGYADPFQAWSWATLVPQAREIDERVSPPRTV